MGEWWQVLIVVFGATGFWSLIQFLIDRFDKKRNLSKQIKEMGSKNDERFTQVERDLCRTQLLLMIKSYPKQHKEILTLANHYFVDLKGNWYMEDLFDDWLEKEKVSKPNWVKGEQK